MIQIVGIGGVAVGTLDGLTMRVARELRESCHVRTEGMDPEIAFDPARGQHHSTAILGHLAGVAAVDLYAPIFTFVYGESQLGGPATRVSTYRLRPEFYGEEPNGAIVAGRL